jgi:carbamoyl-phosphate synthase large subunit
MPRCTAPDFESALIELALRAGIHLIVPTIDTELPVMAGLRSTLLERGIWVSVSDPQTVSICADKVLTNAWLVERGFPTVRQASLASVQQASSGWLLPLIVKPRAGSASIGVRRIAELNELRAIRDTENRLIVEEIAPGREFTVNVYVDKNGRCRCAVPHERLEVRGGEVSKGITNKHRGMMELAANIAESLPGARGALNIQCFLDKDGRVRVVEINARFGGGYPLAHRAGAPFTKWLLQEALDLAAVSDCADWQPGLAMLRYDQAIFTTADRLSRMT